jgi:transcriptional regulator with XRE-family HTH domain
LERHLSQAQAAHLAKISRVTLNRWENNQQQPRVADLELLLGALSARQEQRQQALALLGTPPAQAQIRSILVQVGQHQVGQQKDIGPLSHGGDLLRAMRMRCGLSKEETAQRVGVTTRTLRRWEKAEVWPSPTHLQTLCYVLHARTEEMVALSTSQLSPQSGDGNASLDDLVERGNALCHDTERMPEEALKELHFLTLEAQAWPLAARSEAGVQFLAKLYSYHAHLLSCYDRFSEIGYYAHLALDLCPPEGTPSGFQTITGIAAARAAVFSGGRHTPEQGLKMLKYWLNAAPWFDFQAWILSDMAKYLAQAGYGESSLSLARQAKKISERCHPIELANRELDMAQIMIWNGQAAQALPLIHRHRQELAPYSLLLEVEANLSLKDLDRASEKLKEVLELVESKRWVQWQPRARLLAQRVK